MGCRKLVHLTKAKESTGFPAGLVDSAALNDVMSATKEELKAESDFNSRLIDAVAGALIDLPQQDLSKWSYRCSIFTNLDKAIDSALATAETESVARSLLLILLYKACDRLTSPNPLIDAPPSKSKLAKQTEARYAKISKAAPKNG